MLINMIRWPFVYYAADEGGNGSDGGQQDPPAGDGDEGDGDKPAAGQQQDGGQAPAGQGGQQDEPIRDPEAWAKAEVDKYQRLHSKAQDRIKALEAQMATMQESQKQAVQQQIDEMKAEMQQQVDESRAALVKAKREKAVLAAGLPETAAQFITADEDDEIATQVAQLKELAPAQDGGTPQRQPRTGNPATESTLTLDEIRRMSQEEIRRRWDEVQSAYKRLS